MSANTAKVTRILENLRVTFFRHYTESIAALRFACFIIINFSPVKRKGDGPERMIETIKDFIIPSMLYYYYKPGSLRSKRFRAVSEQRPREKWRK